MSKVGIKHGRVEFYASASQYDCVSCRNSGAVPKISSLTKNALNFRSKVLFESHIAYLNINPF